MHYTVYFFHMLEHKPKSLARTQSKRICCPAEADTSVPSRSLKGCICSLKGELAEQCEHSTRLAAPLSYMPASQTARGQETACLSMLEDTQKSPRAIASYWHLGASLEYPRGYPVNPVLRKGWRHSSKHSLDISKVLHGQMESLCLSICRLKA